MLFNLHHQKIQLLLALSVISDSSTAVRSPESIDALTEPGRVVTHSSIRAVDMAQVASLSQTCSIVTTTTAGLGLPFTVRLVNSCGHRVISRWTPTELTCHSEPLCQLRLIALESNWPSGITYTHVSQVFIPGVGGVRTVILECSGGEWQSIGRAGQSTHTQALPLPRANSWGPRAHHFLACQARVACRALTRACAPIAYPIAGALHVLMHVKALVPHYISVGDDRAHRRTHWTGPRGAVRREVLRDGARLIETGPEVIEAAAGVGAEVTDTVAVTLIQAAGTDGIRTVDRSGVGVEIARD